MDPKLLAALREYIDAQCALECARNERGDDGYPLEVGAWERDAKEAWAQVEAANTPPAAK